MSADNEYGRMSADSEYRRMTLHPLCQVDDVAPGTARRFDVGPHRICLVRIDDRFFAVGDTCSHADVSLSEGEVDAATRHIECWKHGSCFSLETGEPDTLPATRPIPVYEVVVEDDKVKVAITGE